MTKDVQISIRVPTEFLDRANRLTEALLKNADNAAMGLNRAMVLRLALARGLDALEAEKGPRTR